MTDLLRTFCHVSDYGVDGYKNLHRMVASSSPLVLWAPSGVLVEAHSEVATHEFVDLLNERKIVVVAREDWLHNGLRRKAREAKWEGAGWTKGFDTEILHILKEEESRNVPNEQRRVIVAEEERGEAVAKDYFEQDERRIDKVWKIVKSRNIPTGQHERVLEHVGTLDKKRYMRGEKHVAVRQVLRDAINHSDAIDISGAELPFLSIEDGKFFSLLQGTGVAPARAAGADRQDLRILSAWVLRVLDHLDEMKRSIGRRQTAAPTLLSVSDFLKSDAHSEFVAWLSLMRKEVEGDKLAYIEHRRTRDVLAPMDKWLEEHGYWRTLFPGERGDVCCAIAALIVAVLGLYHDPTGQLSIAGLLPCLIPIIRGQLRELGLVNANYQGMKWPFLYAFGDQPTHHDIQLMAEWLWEFKQEVDHRPIYTGGDR